uniref:Uncharacterized protein n=1 Tax=Caenorhabditis japonica TaxID=281687 RepID=A0A8R1DTW4_CAEJA
MNNAAREGNGTTPANELIDLKNESEPLVNSIAEKSGPVFALLQCATLLVLVLGVIQYAYGVTDHSSLMKMQFAASALAFISSIEYNYSKNLQRPDSDMQSVFLLFRTAGTVFYIACLFLNLTHCFEEISDINTFQHATAATEMVVEAHGHELSDWTLYLSIADVIIKLIVILAFNALSINFFASFVALVSPAIFTLLVYTYKFMSTHFLSDWLDHHLEPVVSIVLTIVCIGIAIFSLIRKKQFLLAEGPKEFSINKISDSVKSQNANLEKIDHVHASCEWPRGFTVSLKAYIKVEKTDKNWVARAADDFAHLKTLLHTEIKAEGAKEVIVEPVFVDRNESANFVDPICISPSCHNEDVGCCTNPKTTAAEV